MLVEARGRCPSCNKRVGIIRSAFMLNRKPFRCDGCSEYLKADNSNNKIAIPFAAVNYLIIAKNGISSFASIFSIIISLTLISIYTCLTTKYSIFK